MKTKKLQKNPVTLSNENVRRWAYTNIPKYKLDEFPEIGVAFIRYFNINSKYLDVWLANLKPYFKLWFNINNNKSIKGNQIQIKYWWRFYLVDHPEYLDMIFEDISLNE